MIENLKAPAVMPFVTPVRIEPVVQGQAHHLIGGDAELILETWAGTVEELAEIVRRVNAYDVLVDTLRTLRLCDGSQNNVRDAETLASRVRSLARVTLEQMGEEP